MAKETYPHNIMRIRHTKKGAMASRPQHQQSMASKPQTHVPMAVLPEGHRHKNTAKIQHPIRPSKDTPQFGKNKEGLVRFIQ